jgi:hypothetical protein
MVYNPKDKNPSGVVLFGNNGSDQVFESVTDFVYDTGNTRLGISTSSPQYTLDVSGTGTFHTIRFADGTQMSTTGGGGGGGSTSPGGSNTQVQFNDSGSFGGDSNFTWDKSSDKLTISVNHINDALLLTSTEGSSDASPVLTLKRDSSTPADGDYLGQLKFKGESDTSAERVYAKITAKTLDVSNGTEDGLIEYMVREAGSNKIMSRFRGDGIRVLNGANFIAEGDGKVGVGDTSPTYQVDVVGTGNFTGGVRFPDGNVQTVAYTGGAGGGGMVSWTIEDGSSNSEAISNSETLYISGAGSVTTTFNGTTNVMTVSGAAGGGGGSPGGSVNQIQINDGAGGFTAAGNSDRFIYDTSTNTLDIGRQSIDDTSGAQVTNYWYTNNFAIGGNNFINLNTATADFNTAVGISALQDLSEGDRNVAVGYFAGDDITQGDDNICIGAFAGETMSTASDNILIGSFAGSDFSTNLFVGNVVIGTNAMRTAATSSINRNVFIGTDAGYDADKVSDNVAIGYRAFYSSSFSTDAVHNIYIGDDCPNSTLDANGTGNLIIRSVGGYGTLSQFIGQGNNELCIGNIYAGNQETQRAGIGDVDTIGDSPDAALHIQPINSSDLVLKVQGAAAQSANLQEWKDSLDTELASVGPSGRLYYQSSYSPISNEGTASSFTFDLDTHNVFSGTLNGATTLATSNGDVGQRFMVRLKQDGTGGRTVSTWFGNRVSWPGGSAPTLSSSANLVDLFGFLVTSGTAPTLYYDGFTIATGIQ